MTSSEIHRNPATKPIPPPPGIRLASAPPAAAPGPARQPAFPEQTLKVTALTDPVLDRLGHDPRSVYVERYWLPILGPSCLLLTRKMSAELEQHPEGFDLTTVQWARELGVGMKGGRNGPLWRAVERACRFGAAQRNGELLAVRRRLPPLTARQVERLPDGLRASHDGWVETRLGQPRRATVAKWSAGRDTASAGQDRSFDDAA